MGRSKRFMVMVLVPLVAIFAAASLSATAEEPKKPPAKSGPAKPLGHRGPAAAHPGLKGPGARGPGGPHHAFDRDRSHWGQRQREAWAHGRWYPYGCRFGLCGYWWWADGYWYYYAQPLEGPPDVVSDRAYPDQSAPPDEEAPPDQPPPPAVYPYGAPVVPVPVLPLPCIGPFCLR